MPSYSYGGWSTTDCEPRSKSLLDSLTAVAGILHSNGGSSTKRQGQNGFASRRGAVWHRPLHHLRLSARMGWRVGSYNGFRGSWGGQRLGRLDADRQPLPFCPDLLQSFINPPASTGKINIAVQEIAPHSSLELDDPDMPAMEYAEYKRAGPPAGGRLRQSPTFLSHPEYRPPSPCCTPPFLWLRLLPPLELLLKIRTPTPRTAMGIELWPSSEIVQG